MAKDRWVLNGRYQVSALLGEGGMAMVYEAEDLLLGRKVAVKVLREQFATDKAFLARFQREARAAAALSHPNIVTVYDVGSESGIQYIVMELVEGRTLKELIEEEAPLSAARIIDLGRQICEGLEYAHRRGLVHRDVKPHNILVTREGRVKIADFGIAVALGASSLTQSGYIVGSAHYISPEQAKGDPTTPYSDLYSVGIVLYEMATGRLPFEGETSVVVALKQIQETPIPPRQFNPRIPDSLQSVILRAMAKSPTERFESGEAIGEALMARARAGLEATQPHQIPAGPSQRPAKGSAAAPALGRRERKNRSSGWMVLVVVGAAFLCTLGSIPLVFLAYSGGSFAGFLPGAGAPPTATSPAATPSAGPAGVASPSSTTTATPTASPTPSPTPIALQAPKLVGLPFPAARQLAQASELEVVIAGESYDLQHPQNYVISQSPPEGNSVEKGARIEVVVSLGKEIAAVPRVVGDTAPVAEGRLHNAGFRWRLVEQISEQVPAGVVISQNPAGDTRADKGSEVVLTVSSGREKVPVPNVVGRPEAEAQAMIARAGLSTATPNYQSQSDIPPGIVITSPPGYAISQEPKPGTSVEKGSTVYIAVWAPRESPPPQKKP